MQRTHGQSGPSKWAPASARRIANSLSFILILILVSSSGIEAIVKQQHQQQQQQQQQQQAQSQQSRSDDPSASAAAYNNHQSQQQSVPVQQQQQQQVSGAQNYAPQASSVSVSSSVSSSAVTGGQQQHQASGRSGAAPGGLGQLDSLNAYHSAAGPSHQKPNSGSYMDSMSAAASNPEQSYQAAAQSVNLALANSGIYNSAAYPAAANSQQQVQAAGQQINSASSASSLNPLHYFYYPAKDVPSSVGAQQAKANGHELANGNQFMANSYGPSYADQLGSALSSLGGGGSGSASAPEAAASNQDASYLPQPIDQNNQLYPNNQGQAGVGPQQGQQQQQQQQSPQQYNGDLSGYASSQNGQQAPQQSGSISFSGPTAISGNPNANQLSNGNGNNNYQPLQGDYLNSHLGAGQPNGGIQQQQQQIQAQQQQQQSAAYPNSNIFGSLGDLQTSNFGNSGGLSSIASYMPPGSSSQHDLFASSFGQQFNPAASQLNPAAVAPGSQQQPAPGQQSGNGHSSLFGGAASSLFGGSSASQQQQAGAGGSLFSGQHYLSSFLSPQQISHLTGGQSQQELAAASNSAASAVAPAQASSSGKRFGISSFIMPMLALAGLSLLIPTMSNIGTAVGRKKRSIVEERASASSRQQQINFDPINGSAQVAKETSIGEYLDKIERYYSIYKNAVESDDCLNRLICEFGDAVKDITGKSAVVTVIEKLVPNWMTGKMHLFKEAALDNKEGKEKCKKYVCHSSRVH